MSDEGFDPDDIADLEAAFLSIEQEKSNAYRMEFIISDLTMEEMIDEWSLACMGDRKMMKKCWDRYGYIMRQIIDAKLDED